MNKCWEPEYSQYEHEAEWFGNPEPNIWLCDIPSIMKSVRLTLDLDTKTICIEERKIEELGFNRRYGQWKTMMKYWK